MIPDWYLLGITVKNKIKLHEYFEKGNNYEHCSFCNAYLCLLVDKVPSTNAVANYGVFYV